KLEDIESNYLKKDHHVDADYHIFKNLIFARRTLDKDKLDKYEQIFNILTKDMIMQNIIIYLHASLDNLLKRIRQRGRDIEQNIQEIYIEQLTQDYEEYMDPVEMVQQHIPIIYNDGDKTDFIKHQDDLKKILNQVTTKLKIFNETMQKGEQINEFKREIQYPKR